MGQTMRNEMYPSLPLSGGGFRMGGFAYITSRVEFPAVRRRTGVRLAQHLSPVLTFRAGMTHEISGLLLAWGQGNEEALNELMPVVYPELRRIARKQIGRCGLLHTLQSVALANEAYLKLIRSGGIRCENRTHFFALCAQIIRRILVDHARKRQYAKRGGGMLQVALEDAVVGAQERGIDILALEEALLSLSKLDPRKSRIVELRYFGGLSVEEVAQVLNVSLATVMRDWKLARTWLYRELRPAAEDSGSRLPRSPLT